MFDLKQYTEQIRSYATKNRLEPAVAVTKFVENLAVMRDAHEIDSSIDFRSLGHDWNMLRSAERVKQKQEALNELTRSRRVGVSYGGRNE